MTKLINPALTAPFLALLGQRTGAEHLRALPAGHSLSRLLASAFGVEPTSTEPAALWSSGEDRQEPAYLLRSADARAVLHHARVHPWQVLMTCAVGASSPMGELVALPERALSGEALTSARDLAVARGMVRGAVYLTLGQTELGEAAIWSVGPQLGWSQPGVYLTVCAEHLPPVLSELASSALIFGSQLHVLNALTHAVTGATAGAAQGFLRSWVSPEPLSARVPGGQVPGHRLDALASGALQLWSDYRSFEPLGRSLELTRQLLELPEGEHAFAGECFNTRLWNPQADAWGKRCWTDLRVTRRGHSLRLRVNLGGEFVVFYEDRRALHAGLLEAADLEAQLWDESAGQDAGPVRVVSVDPCEPPPGLSDFAPRVQFGEAARQALCEAALS